MAQDLLIEQAESDGFFDLVVGEHDLATVDGLETTIAVLLFTDARAAPEEMNDPSKRRGWVGNVLRSSELGGMLWLLTQMRNTQENRNKIVNWVENSLQPLLDDKLATSVEARIENTTARGTNIIVSIVVKEGRTEKFDYWVATDLGNIVNAN